MKVFDVDEVIMRGVRGVDASGNSGASNWVPNTRTGRVFIKSADTGEFSVARRMARAGMWTRSESLMLLSYVGLRWMVATGHKVRWMARRGAGGAPSRVIQHAARRARRTCG